MRAGRATFYELRECTKGEVCAGEATLTTPRSGSLYIWEGADASGK